MTFKFLIFGNGTELVKKLLEVAPENVKDRIEILGFVEREKIKALLSDAKIFFVPSRWESFSIASAEALCTGCSDCGNTAGESAFSFDAGFLGNNSIRLLSEKQFWLRYCRMQ